jgi:hypothetical protein
LHCSTLFLGEIIVSKYQFKINSLVAKHEVQYQ